MSTLRRSSTIRWELDGIGEVILKRRRKSRRISIAVKPSNQVVVNFPVAVPISKVKLFVMSKSHWIKESLEKNNQRLGFQPIASGYRTRNHQIITQASNTDNTSVKVEGNHVILSHPREWDTASADFKEVFLQVIAETYRMEAQEVLPHRLAQLSQQHNLPYNSHKIKNITSRWGSCSAKGNINLSIYLMKLPDYLIDYVILHELAHTVHMNHGAEFWAFLEELVGNAKALSRELKQHNCGP